MPAVPGTKIGVTFYTFSSDYPPLYFGAGEGTGTLASVNAGNSLPPGLEVGLGGVNKQFLADLRAAGQSKANLSSQQDDYYDRHHKLVAKADGAGGAASESYSDTNPMAFSYVRSARLNQTGSMEGVCFVDVFGPKMVPAGNAKNAAMIYVGAPHGKNYPVESDFLAAIQAMAVTIVKTVAGYNAIAAKQNLPTIEVLRNTLYSSGIYNAHSVDAGAIARAIFAGFASELKAGNSGITELQFPVGTAAGVAGELFLALQDDLTGGGAAPVAHRVGVGAPARHQHQPPVVVEGSEDDDDNDDDNSGKLPAVKKPGGEGTQPKLAFQAGDANSAKKQVDNDVDALNQQQGGGQKSQYTAAPSKPVKGPAPRKQYEGVNDPLDGDNDNDAQNQQPAQPVAAVQAEQPVYAELELASEEESTSDGGGDNSVCKSVLKGVVGGLLMVGIGGILYWIFGLGAGRKVVGDGPLKFKPKDIDKKASVAENPVDVDLLKENGIIWVQAIEFVQADGTNGPKLPNPDGKWTVDANQHVLFKPTVAGPEYPLANKSVSAEYVLTAVGSVAPAIADKKKLTIEFGPAALPITVTAPDRTGAFEIDILALSPNPGFNGAVRLIQGANQTQVDTAPAVDKTGKKVGTWNVDSATQRVKFTPDGTVAADQTEVLYVLVPAGGTASNEALLHVDFPPAGTPVTPKVLPIEIPDVPRMGPFSIDVFTRSGNPGFTGALKLIENSNQVTSAVLKDSAGAIIGAWTVTAGSVDFTPVGTFAGPFAEIPYVLVNAAGAASNEANLKLIFQTAGMTTAPIALAITIPNAPRMGATDVDVPTLSGNPGFAGTVKLIDNGARVDTFPAKDKTSGATLGTWAVTPAKRVTFTPIGTYPDPEATAPYVLVSTAGAASNESSITLKFPPTGPALTAKPLEVPDASRTLVSYFDVPVANGNPPGLTAVKLIDVDRVQKDFVSIPREGTWTVLADRRVSFTPATPPVKPDSASRPYVLISGGTASNEANLKATFTRTPEAYLFSIKAPSTAAGAPDRDATIIFYVESMSVTPDGFQGVRLIDPADDQPKTDVRKFNVGQWLVQTDTAGGRTVTSVHFNPARGLGAAPPTEEIEYYVIDRNGKQSARSRLIVDYRMAMMRQARLMPRAADFLLAADVTGGKLAGCDVLADSVSVYPKNPQSVVLLGLQHVGQSDSAQTAWVKDDGKAVSVPGEGCWLVDDNGMIAFQADKDLDHPPTAVSFQFADAKGNLSNPAAIVIDPALDHIAAITQKMSQQNDADFWTHFHKSAIEDQTTDLTPQQMIVIAQTLAGVIRSVGPVGPNPFSDADFNSGYAEWTQGGQLMSDLYDICQKIADKATTTSKAKYAARYWRLSLMVWMAAKALPPKS